MSAATHTEPGARFESVAAHVFDPLQRCLRRCAAAEDAADVSSATLLTIWRRFDGVPSDDARPWCYGVARRALANHRRGIVDYCGHTGPATPELQTLFDQAFPG